ncbi:MAG: transglycosylase SLT domain-containing protein [Balneolales bacterium]
MEKNNYITRVLMAIMVIAFILAAVNIAENDAKDIRQHDINNVVPYDVLDMLQEEQEPVQHENIPQAHEPVDLDFPEILDRGTIRLITNYNVGSYFLQGGFDRGFEYEFFAAFARKHDLNIEIIILQPGDDPVEMLNRGEGDIIASNFIKTPWRNERVSFSEPYNLISQHLIVADSTVMARLPEDLDNMTISVRKHSAHHETLVELQDQGHQFEIDLIAEAMDTEALVVGVANGRFQATVADDHEFSTIQTYVKGVTLGPALAEGLPVGWGVRKGAGQLQKEVDKYIYGNFKYDEESGKIWKSGFMALLLNRYFSSRSRIEEHRQDVSELMYFGVLSPYDDMIRPEAESRGVDWKLVVAVMAQESAFRPNAISFAGAVGLMQIIPRFSEVRDEAKLMDPKTNIDEGLRYLKKHLTHYAYLDEENQLALTLASYNAGVGHVADARRLAMDANKDPNDWNDVAEGLLKLTDQKYYRQARYGYCRGTETVDYVRKVLARYKTYQAIARFADTTVRDEVEETILAMGRISEN